MRHDGWAPWRPRPPGFAVSTVELSLIERLAGLRVLVVGDAMLDEYVEGDADRICPEAPVPVVRVDRHDRSPGRRRERRAERRRPRRRRRPRNGGGSRRGGGAAGGALRGRGHRHRSRRPRGRPLDHAEASRHRPAAPGAAAGLGADRCPRAARRRGLARPTRPGAASRHAHPERLREGSSHSRGPPARHRPGPGLGRSGPRRSQGSRPDRYRGATVLTPNRREFAGWLGLPRTPSSLAGSPSWAAPSSTASCSTISW